MRAASPCDARLMGAARVRFMEVQGEEEEEEEDEKEEEGMGGVPSGGRRFAVRMQGFLSRPHRPSHPAQSGLSRLSMLACGWAWGV